MSTLERYTPLITGNMQKVSDGEWVKRDEVLELLGALIKAGQAMRDCNYINTANSMAWDAAIEKLANGDSESRSAASSGV